MASASHERIGTDLDTICNLTSTAAASSRSHPAETMYFEHPTDTNSGTGDVRFSQLAPDLLPIGSAMPPTAKHSTLFPPYVQGTHGDFSHMDPPQPSLADASSPAFTNQPLYAPAATLTSMVPADQAAAASDEPRAVIANTASLGSVQGILLPGAIYHRRPGQNFPQRRYAVLLDHPIAETDCGAAVVEPATERIYGQIVQVVWYSRVQVAYVVCMADALWDVNSRFDEGARLATLWYNKQRKTLPSYPRTGTGAGYGPRVGFGMSSTEPVSGHIIGKRPWHRNGLLRAAACAHRWNADETPLLSAKDPTAFIHAQSGFAYCDSNEPVFTPSSSSSSELSSLKLSAGSVASVSDLLARTIPGRHSGPKKRDQVQFVHYRAAGMDRGKRKADNDTSDTGSPLCLEHHSADAAELDTAINVLLPDRKCPFRLCEYHKKGFVRKHDLVRHVITHYNGQLYCGFCPDGLAKSFGRPFLRVEPLKRHLAAVHHAAKFRKTPNTTETYLKLRLKEYGPVKIGHCTICERQFLSASELYNHVESCVIQLLLQQAREGNDGPQEENEDVEETDPVIGQQRWEAEQQASRSGIAAGAGWGDHNLSGEQ